MCFVLEMALRGGSEKLHSQIASEITRLIAEGLIGCGYPLPSTRLLSEHLGVSRNTVLRAYENLAAEGIVEMRPPRGTFVSEKLPADIPAAPFAKLFKQTPKNLEGRPSGKLEFPAGAKETKYDFQYERISKDVVPSAMWRRITFEKMRALPNEMAKADHPAGSWDLRCAIAEYLGPSRSIKIAPEQVIVTAGLQQSISVAVSMFSGPRHRAVVEQPRYSGFDAILDNFGYETFPVEADRYGLRTDLLPEVSSSLVCVTAGRQFPFGGTLPHDRREELYLWAKRSGAHILDAEIQNDYRYDGLLPAALMRDDQYGRTMMAGSFTSSLGSGVRLGYLVVPMDAIGRAVHAAATLGNTCGWLDQAVLANFIKTGGYKHHLLRLRKTMMARKDAAISEISERFGDIDIVGANGGSFFIWRLPPGFPGSDEVVRILKAAGLVVSSFNSGLVSCEGSILSDQRHLMVGYGGMAVDELRRAAAQMADVLEARFGSQRVRGNQVSVPSDTVLPADLGMAP